MKRILYILLLCMSASLMQAQIVIGGNVYGGGNAGDLNGSTKVTIYAGEFKDVYGGARMANVGGSTFVNLDGENASDDIFIVNTYGGNDIAGTIGQGSVVTKVPGELENIKRVDEDADDKTKNAIDNTTKTFIRTSACKEEDKVTVSEEKIDSKMLVVASLFGGGNGDYIYKGADGTTDLTDSDGKYIVRDGKGNTVATSVSPFIKPDLSSTYLEIKGGCIAHVYGGGNNATVTGSTLINIDNSSDDLQKGAIVFAGKHPEISNVITYFQSKVKLATFQSKLTSWAFNHARIFGGNNKAHMYITPKWNLQQGVIRDLYSGGNEGDMRSSHGLLLDIDPQAPTNLSYDEQQAIKNKLQIDNVYGGCRRADVRPMLNNQDTEAISPGGYNFPKGLSARTLVRGGKITNVYGGNDISGKVYGGNAVGIYTSILGDVYGGGNGSYAYTDNSNLATNDECKDFYYNPGSNSIEALNAFRPNAEQVSIRLYGGEDAAHPIIIHGSVFVGGNSATLKKKEGVKNPMVELKIGSNVIANNVFLGNNGANMIKYGNDNDVLDLYKKYVGSDGKFAAEGTAEQKYSTLDLTNSVTFKKYMEGCAMDLMPSVVFDNIPRGDPADYHQYTSYFGSFYCGGNVGSMTSAGATTIDFSHKVVIFDKLVGGCNSAIVESSNYNARYEGGLIGENNDPNGNKLVLNLSGLKVQPKRWNDAGTELIWNTVDSRKYDVDTKTYDEMDPVSEEDDVDEESDDDDLARRLFGGNIYGGCCESGVVNGNVVINLNETIIERDKLFDVVESGELGEENSLYGESQTAETKYHITKRNTGVILGQQGMDVFGQALNVFGGGKGKKTEIWGSTTINLNKGYTFQIFGGSEEGTIGKPTGTTDNADLTYTTSGNTLTYSFNGKTFEYNPAYSCYVNLCGTVPGVSKSDDNQNDNMADCEFMYGGGFFGPICGNTVINLGAGRIFNSFAGSCNADILGHAETYIGRQVKVANKNRMAKLALTETSTGSNTYILDNDTCYQDGFTWVRDITYGANDLGGRIFGSKDFTNRVRKANEPSYGLDVLSMVHQYNAKTNPNPEVLTAGAYTEYLQGRADAIFGGCYGTYDYSDPKFMRYTYTTDDESVPTGFDLGDSKVVDGAKLFYKPRVYRAFVNFRPTYSHTNNVVKRVFGAGQGESGEKERDLLQDASYVLIDIPQVSETSGNSGGSGTANFNKFSDMEVFGAGSWGGVGMRETLLPMAEPAEGAAASTVEAYNEYLSKLDKQSAIIDLVRGDIGAAYGASFEEGVTRRTVVNVPRGSTIKIGSIFGGGYGNDIYQPCDAYEAHVEYHSKDAWLIYNPLREENGKVSGNAKMKGTIYGGNNNARRTIYAKVNIDVPVNQVHWKYGTSKGYVYGAGHGGNTWAEYTEVNLNKKPNGVTGDYTGAWVYEVYGGGEAGKVFNTESVEYYMKNAAYKPAVWPVGSAKAGKEFTDADWAAAWKIGGGLDPADNSKSTYWENTYTNLANPLVRVAEMDDRDFSGLTEDDLALVKGRYTANVIINEGAYVGNYVYGGGYGDEAVVSGTTYVALLGGEVKKDIYAAGTSGDVGDMYGVGKYTNAARGGFTASTNVYVKGGTCRNVYGGGWRGDVGYHKGAISNVAANDHDRDAEVHIVVGDVDGTSHVNGIPSITRNLYGGGEGGAIFGDAYVTLNKGYIGYRYNGELHDNSDTELDDRYVPELDDANAGDNLLDKGGNIFGGGYVANSYVDRTHINMWDGFVRGSLYGGGEIGPVGRGTVHADSIALYPASKKHDYEFEGCQPAAIYKGGETHVYLWGGHVMRDVFGGGRGYDNWNGEGFFQSEEEKQNMDRSSKGYVFGSTDVHIRGGEVGTEEGLIRDFGNVFGGGNEGFVYSDKGVKIGEQESDDKLVNGMPATGGGFYYINPVVDGNGKLSSSGGLSLDCNIAIEPYCKVIADGGIDIGSKSYAKGEYVPVEELNKLKNRHNEHVQWEKLDTRGIIIHNALFAGGNITEGSDNLFANTITVYGNAAASMRDVYNYDLISLGTEDLGGLYGDGNLTLVDGFRELHIDNYGTDYYSLDDNLLIDEYNELTDRQKAYYKLKYISNSDHTFEYHECRERHIYEVKDGDDIISSTPYKRGQKISESEFLAFPEEEKQYWTSGHKTFEKDDQIEESEYVLMYASEQSYWALYGVTSIYAGRPLNTIQRADMCGVFGSRMVLKGAEDRVINTLDYHPYTINRVDEVSLNKRTSQAGDTGDDAVHGNYFGIYNEVHFLGNLTSDVFFDDVRKTDSDIPANAADNETTYYGWKLAKPQARNRNNGISHNKVALASGVFLEIKRQEGELTGEDDWGYITGVIELDLINVMQGMGGGYVYARNEHGTKSYHSDWGKVTLLNYNNEARTYRHFAYSDKNTTSSLQPIETSGNFVHNTKQIIDDCYPHGGIYKDGYTKSPAHYWFIRGQIYVYEQYISALTGSANAYAEKVEMPLTISAAANGRMTLREVQPNYYAYYDKNGNKLGDSDLSVNADKTIIINNETYHLNDPVSFWAYSLMTDAEKARFVEETYVVVDTCKVNGTLYEKGMVMLPSEYKRLQNSIGSSTIEYMEDGEWKSDDDHGFDYFFRSSNNLSSSTGYVLTYDVNNPMVWNNYYTKTAAPGQANYLSTTEYSEGKKGNVTITRTDYTEGPTFTPKSGQAGVYAQQDCNVGDIIFAKTKTNYDNNVKSHIAYTAVADGTTLTAGKTYYTSSTGTDKFTATGEEVADGTNYYTNGQAIVTEQAYIVTKEYSVKDAQGVEVQHLNVGTPIYQAKYTPTQWNALTSGSSPVAEPAKVCTTFLEFSATDYVYAGQLMTAAEVAALKSKVIAMNKYTNDATLGTAEAQATAFLATCFDNAYYCTEEGRYGGSYFNEGVAYSALETWCAMTAEEREKFDFNYDALNLLVDPNYDRKDSGEYDDEHYGYKPKYDGYDHVGTKLSDRALPTKVYSAQQPIDYQAEFAGYEDKDGNKVTTLSYKDKTGATVPTITASSDEAHWLTREQYEAIPNEKHHYSPITVTAPGNYYVVNTVFMRGDVPYTIGQVIDETTYLSMTSKQQTNVDVYSFTESDCTKDEDGQYVSKNYFYCRSSYYVNEKGEGKAVTTKNITKNDSEVAATTYVKGAEVPQGVIIDQSAYDLLPNFQQGFIIHGMSPTETSTLYVSSASDIHDLSTEKIITVIYLYEYEESDESGLNVVPVSERHIVNIHINFKSGVPEIGDILKPDVVLPGTTIGMNVPTVSQGAYRVTESGWELFSSESDAHMHTNGMPYINNTTPVYWYQNNYWIAYYAKTYLGKTYSNSVPISVANFHDLKKVMDDKLHHYYIDHQDTDYEPKIYINDYSSTGENGLDLFKNLIDLSYENLEYVTITDPEDESKTITVPKPIASGTLEGHVPLDNTAKPMRGGEYLEFFLRADQYHEPTTEPNPAHESDPEAPETITVNLWTPIASGDGQCFEGILHGDGHTISGLDKSLFNHLCGDVYNLGVTGTFTGAGVAETGSGYVENCWIKTSATSGFNSSTKAVYGNPEADGSVHVVNCYYPEAPLVLQDPADPSSGLVPLATYYSEESTARKMPEKAFYNGEVAYDLNGFYLWKRYCDQSVSVTDEAQKYQYYTIGSDDKLTLQPETYYTSDPDLCSSGYKPSGVSAEYVTGKYVEDRFADGDFIYVGDGFGTIPTSANERLYVDPETQEPVGYFPIWPDDYIFFGQALNYGHMDGKNGRDLRTHQELPSVINKSNERIVATNEGNRVYRAPAYFRSKKMGVAHFNSYAVFAAKEKLTAANVTAREVYPDMTAIDFTGYNDAVGADGANRAYEKGLTSTAPYNHITGGAFYPPLLDDGGVRDFFNADLTQNLLAYTMTTTSAAQLTDDAVSAYMTDVAYSETNSKYHTVDAWNGNIGGHWVQKQDDNSFLAKLDHMLVDKQDFNAPIAYSFASTNRMWYQRMPNTYVEPAWSDAEPPVRSTKGWEGVSLPFKAEIVTTDVKGEITHFYSGSWTSKNGTNTKIGHEYWLREYKGGAVDPANSSVFVANFNYPESNSTDGEKDYTNTFLWDYYYSYNDYQDLNKDQYQENDENHYYYSKARKYENYPRLAAGMPYIIGFPSKSYYEFDLSGEFEATTALEAPKIDGEKLGRQTITFASETGTTILVSDDEMEGVTAGTGVEFTFKPNYLKETLINVAANDKTDQPRDYYLNSTGDAYVDNDPGDVIVLPFRPYFETTSTKSGKVKNVYSVRQIVFAQDENTYFFDENDPKQAEANGELIFYTQKHLIGVKSSLRNATDVLIINTAGQIINSFIIQPGETIETRIPTTSVYIIRAAGGRFNKKVTVE